MAIPRNKGQFVQAGTVHAVPNIDGSFLSMDGMLDLDQLVLQSDYPELYAQIGTTYNIDTDDDLTEFRTPKIDDVGLPSISPAKCMMRF